MTNAQCNPFDYDRWQTDNALPFINGCLLFSFMAMMTKSKRFARLLSFVFIELNTRTHPPTTTVDRLGKTNAFVELARFLIFVFCFASRTRMNWKMTKMCADERIEPDMTQSGTSARTNSNESLDWREKKKDERHENTHITEARVVFVFSWPRRLIHFHARLLFSGLSIAACGWCLLLIVCGWRRCLFRCFGIFREFNFRFRFV